MNLSALLTQDTTACCKKVFPSKRQFFDWLADEIHQRHPHLISQHILSALQKREQLGSTALTAQVAIPHARLAQLKAPFLFITQLTHPLNYDPEHQHIDLVFTLLVPEDAPQAHLNILGQLATQFKNPAYYRNLRQATNASTLLTAARQLTENTTC